MLVHRIVRSSAVNGPGNRFVVWVQGCSRRCKGCFNQDTWPATGNDMSIRQILAQLPPKGIDGLTVSGGEPFEQPGDLSRLLREAKQLGLHTLVYTGFTVRELEENFVGIAGDLLGSILANTDILIDGAYDHKVPQRHPWAGSGNQRVLILRHGVVIDEDPDVPSGCVSGEIEIGDDGSVTATGFLDGHLLQPAGARYCTNEVSRSDE